jgi:CheY-like chemotaxis protein
VNLLVLVVDDEPDVEVLFRQQFRRDFALAGSPWSSPNPPPPRSSASPPLATVLSRGGAISFLFARDGVEALAALKANGQIDISRA